MQYVHSNGFCVLSDFPVVDDVATMNYGLVVAILVIYAHNGDAKENMLKK